MKTGSLAIDAATRYIQILYDRNAQNLTTALDKYGTGPGYSTNLIAARKALDANPADPMAALAKTIGPF